MTYSDKLKDPRWQKKRLEIFNLQDWKCQNCGSATDQLHLHHRYYKPKTEPWDYPNSAFLTLCHECHDDATASVKSFDETFKSALMPIHLGNIADYFAASPEPSSLCKAIAIAELMGDIGMIRYLSTRRLERCAELDPRQTERFMEAITKQREGCD